MLERDRRVGREAWKAYYRRVRERWHQNWGDHFWAQVAVSLVIAALGGALGIAFGLGVLSLAVALGGFGVYLLGAAAFYRRRAPVELDLEAVAERAELEGELALLVRDRDQFDVELLEEAFTRAMPLSLHVQGRLDDPHVAIVILRVHNRGAAGYFTAQVEEVDGGLVRAADLPWFIPWRGAGQGRERSIEGGGRAVLGLAEAHPFDLLGTPAVQQTLEPRLRRAWTPGAFAFLDDVFHVPTLVQMPGVRVDADGSFDARQQLLSDHAIVRLVVKVTDTMRDRSARFRVGLGYELDGAAPEGYAPRAGIEGLA